MMRFVSTTTRSKRLVSEVVVGSVGSNGIFDVLVLHTSGYFDRGSNRGNIGT